MPKSTNAGLMTAEQFLAALDAIGWSQATFCRKTGTTKNTPSRWVNGLTPIPAWVPAHLAAMAEIVRLHATFVAPGD